MLIEDKREFVLSRQFLKSGKSANVYDSYAEACMKNSDTKEAIINYKKTLALKSDNPSAKKNLAELMK